MSVWKRGSVVVAALVLSAVAEAAPERHVLLFSTVAVQPDHSILASGVSIGCRGNYLDYFGNGGGMPAIVARFTPEGHLDRSYGDQGIFTLQKPFGSYDTPFAVQSDGRIWLQNAASGLNPTGSSDSGGTTTSGQQPGGLTLARVSPDGKLDTTYPGPVLSADQSSISRFASLPDGRTLAFLSNGMAPTVMRIAADGSLDTSYGQGGFATATVPTPSGSGIYAMPGRALKDGTALQPVVMFGPGQETGALVRFAPDGKPDAAFGQNGVVTFASPVSVVGTDADDAPLVVSVDTAHARSYALSRLAKDGTLDPTFGDHGYVRLPNPVPTDLTMVIVDATANADGKIELLVAAQLNKDQSGAKSIPYLARLNPDGSLDTTFTRTGMLARNLTPDRMEMPTAIAVDDGRTVVASRMMSCMTSRPFLLTRSLPDGTLDDTFGDHGLASP